MNIEARTADFSADQGASARQLAAAKEPVFIFDGKMPVLVWANTQALAFVGHASGPGAQLPHFDRSMPAVARLHALAGQDLPASGLRTELVFWTPAGARALLCNCRRATFAFAPEALIVHGVLEDRSAATTAPTEAATEAQSGTKSAARQRKPGGKGKGRKVKGRKELRTRRGRGTATVAVPAVTVSQPATIGVRPSTAPDTGVMIDGNTLALREIARQIQSATDSRHINGAAPAGVTTEVSEPAGASETPFATAAEVSPLSRHSPDFLSHIGHEIRTPLNSILGFAEIMREERLGPIGNDRYKTYAADIHDSATHALSLINDLLDLSRIEAGGLQLDLTEVDVAAVAAKAVASLRPAAEKAGVQLGAPAGRPLPKLVCDQRSLMQMLLNLLSNAIRHTDAGGAAWVTAATSDEGGLVIRVQDTGVGMRAEDIAMALEPYRQVGAAERRAGGTGLGLPLTKAMAEANGGTLHLERIAGGGLAALLTFPPDKVVRN